MKNKKIFFSSVLILTLAFISFFFLKKNSKESFSETSSFFYHIIEEGITSGSVESGTHILKNRDELNEFWKNINFSRPSVSLPEINFYVNYVVAIVSEEKPTGGYYLHLNKIEEEENKIIISITENQPGAGCFSTQIITQPFSLFIISKTEKELSVKTEKSALNCH